jgi:cobyrinic acid a,c-diamide synthase
MTRALVISAPSSGAGKTVISLGLMRALRDAGNDVASAKSGPDYIDPAFHAAATGRPCATLDAWAMGPEDLRARVPAADLVLVEGAMGLFDAAADGAGATADVAAALGAPVVLVLDSARMAQTAAAVVAGLAAHRADVTVAGVILNRVGSARHEALLRGALAPVAPVLGVIPRDQALATPSRHLGLVQAGERDDLEAFITHAAAIMSARCDLPAIAAAARPVAGPGRGNPLPPLGQRIAVARDIAFAFAYPHMLEDWRRAGAAITPFSPLADEAPDPEADAVFLPGGYPELHAPRLAAAVAFRAGMQAAAGSALIYGECGGYMVLGQSLIDAGGATHRMLGLLPLATSFAERRRQLGYRRLAPLGPAPWAGALMAHEHHQATTILAEGDPLFHAADALGEDLGPIGLRHGRILGSFAHVIAPAR